MDFGRKKAALLGPFERSRAVAEGCENLGKGTYKWPTPGVYTLGVGCQLLGRRIRSQSSGSPRGTLFVTTLSLTKIVSAYRGDICRVRVSLVVSDGTGCEQYCGS